MSINIQFQQGNHRSITFLRFQISVFWINKQKSATILPCFCILQLKIYLLYNQLLFELKREMEGSIIHSLKNNNSSLRGSALAGNSFLGNHRSPSKDQDNIYLYKSRIEHLPADHKEDLSSKLDFVVVFQAIQISRLSQQILFLRGRLKEAGSIGFNTNNYEIQIRQLMQKCNKLQNQKFSYSQQLEQTKVISQSIFNQLQLLKNRYAEVDFCTAQKYKLEKARNEELCMQIQKWKTRYNNLDKNKSEQIEGYKRMLDAQKQNIANRDIKTMMTRYENEKEELMSKLRDRKDQLDQKDLQMKKVMNFYEQAQVRMKEYESKIEEYEEKVAMLSQQTYRLNQMLRIKQQQLKNLKINVENDLSLRMSHITSLDQTKNHLNHKVRQYQQENQVVRNENLHLQETILTLKQRLSQKDRLEHQIYEIKSQVESKVKAIQRKDKKILSLEVELKHHKQMQIQLKRSKEMSHKLNENLRQIQDVLNEKIDELFEIKQKQSELIKENESYQLALGTKIKQFQNLYKNLLAKYNSLSDNKVQIQEMNKINELKVQEIALDIKQKEYKIDQLKNEIKQCQLKLNNQDKQKNMLKKQFQSLIINYKSNEAKIKQIQMSHQMAYKQKEYIKKEMDHKNRYLQEQMKALQMRCNDYEYRQRQLSIIIKEFQHKNAYLEKQLQIKDQETEQMKHFATLFKYFRKQFEEKYSIVAFDLKSLQRRFQTIQNILISLKTKIINRFKDFQEQQLKARRIQMKYDELFEWFVKVNRSHEQAKDISIDSPSSKSFFSNMSYVDNKISKRELQATANSPRSPQKERYNENYNRTNNRNQTEQIPADFLLKFVLICAQVQQLRKRIGDKNAKVESMRNSIAKKSDVNFKHTENGFKTTALIQNGYSTTRQSSSGNRHIYY